MKTRNLAVRSELTFIALTSFLTALAVQAQALPTNAPPTIQGIEPAVVNEGEPFTLSASIFDPDSAPPFQFMWILPDGSTSTAESPPLVLASPGFEQIELAVKDSDGLASGALIQGIEVKNLPPTIVSISPLAGTEGDELKFTATVTHAGGEHLRAYTWTLPGGALSTEASPQHLFALPGSYPLSLKVGEFDLVDVYNNSRSSGETLGFLGTRFEYGDELFLDGTNRVLQRFEFPYFAYLADMTEEEQANARVIVRFYHNDGPDLPGKVNTATPRTLIYESQPLRVHTGWRWAVLDNVNILLPDKVTFSVLFTGVSQDSTGRKAGLVLYHSPTRNEQDIGRSFDDFWWNIAGEWKLFRIPKRISNFGAQATCVSSQLMAESQAANVTIEISNSPPSIQSFSAPEVGLIGTPVSFTAQATDRGSTDLIYEWQFGDGASATGATVNHIYAAEGKFTVALTVKDGFDGTAAKSAEISITADRRALRFSSEPVTSAREDAPYAYEIATIEAGAGQTLVLSAPTKPAWLQFVDRGNGTGLLSGTPGDAEVGNHNVVFELSDGVSSVRQTFAIVVANINDAPTIAPIADQIILMNTTLGPIDLVVADPDIEPTHEFSATSSERTIVPDSGIVISGTGLARRLTVQPVPDTAGPTRITITLKDQDVTASASFTLTVNRPAVRTLTLTAAAGGRTIADPAGVQFKDGSQVRLHAVPDAGFNFTAWTGDASGADNPLLLQMDRDRSVGANFTDAAAPEITILTPAPGPTVQEIADFTGTVTDNVAATSVQWERDGQLMGTLALTDNRFSVAGLRLNRGENRFKVVARDAAGNQSESLVSVIWAPGIVFSVMNAPEQREGRRVTFPIKLTSSGQVGGMTFTLRYNPDFLATPEFTWATVAAASINQVNLDVPGEIQATFSMPGTAIPTGVQNLASVAFQARSVPFSLTTELEPDEDIDASDANGDPILAGIDSFLGTVRITTRTVTGDVNANNRLDIGDAGLLQRMISGLDPQRSWDLALNDINSNNALDSGDVVRILRTVVGLSPQPRLHNFMDFELVSGSDPVREMSVIPLRRVQSSAFANQPDPIALLDPAGISGKAGQQITVRLRVQNLSGPLSGASFQLHYPAYALTLSGPTAFKQGALVPGNSVVVWNHVAADGALAFAASSATNWPANAGVLAEFNFTVNSQIEFDSEWNLAIENFEVNQNGYNPGQFSIESTSFTTPALAPPPRIENFRLLTDGQLEFTIASELNTYVLVETSSNLRDWAPLVTLPNLNGVIRFNDPTAGGARQRFYRLRAQPQPVGTSPVDGGGRE